MDNRRHDYPEPSLEPPEPKERPRCRVCGAEEPDKLYVDKYGVVFGCEECVSEVDAVEWEASDEA